MALDLSSLKEAIGSLERALKVASTMIKGAIHTDQEHVVRAGVIQNFEFTYELCWKFIQRWLSENQNPQEAQEPLTRKELFRTAARCGLIEDPENWFAYSAARNISAHTYDNRAAEKVYAQAQPLLKDAKHLLQKLQKTADD